MGVICKKKVCGCGNNWVIKIVCATNCERCKREATLRGGGGGGGGGHATHYSIKMLKFTMALISVSSHPMYTVHAQNI